MTKEQAIIQLEYRKDFATPDQIEALDMAISALSEELSEDGTLTVHVSDGSKVSRVFVKGDNIFGGLYYPDSAKTDTAKPEEGAELIDRRQIKWYGCDHEGHIKGINCDTADCSKCFYATVEHDEVMSLPVYRIPDSAENKRDLISRGEVESVLHNNLHALIDTDQLYQLYRDINHLPTYSFSNSAENKGEWIPVSERLPEKDMACLVAVGLLNLTQLAIYSDLMGVLDHRIFYQGDVGHESFEDITEYVKAWQPLPEPYKKGE